MPKVPGTFKGRKCWIGSGLWKPLSKGGCDEEEAPPRAVPGVGGASSAPAGLVARLATTERRTKEPCHVGSSEFTPARAGASQGNRLRGRGLSGGSPASSALTAWWHVLYARGTDAELRCTCAGSSLLRGSFPFAWLCFSCVPALSFREANRLRLAAMRGARPHTRMLDSR